MSESSPLLRRNGHVSQSHHNLAGYSPVRFRIICAAIWGCTFLAAFDGTVLATLTSDISSSFNASNQGSWLGTAYLLSVCCFTPIYGRLADILGRRGAHLVGMIFFTLGTLMCTVAPSMYFLLAARLVAGIGGGGIASVGVIVMTDLVDLRRRGVFQGYANIVFGLGSALGGPLGGWISDTLGWRVAFGIQVPPLIAAGIAVWTCLKTGPKVPRSKKMDDTINYEGAMDSAFQVRAIPVSEEEEEETWKDKVKKIDFLGSATLVISVATLILAMSIKTSSTKSNGEEYKWTDPLILGLNISCLVFAMLFLWMEGKFASHPLLPLPLMARRTPAAVGFSLFVLSTYQFSVLYNIPLYFEAVRLDSSSVAGAHLLPFSVLIGVGSLAVGHLIRHTEKYYWTCVGSGVCIVFSAGLLCLWDENTAEWQTWVAQAPTGLGYSAMLTGTLVALMTNVANVGKGEVAVATSMSYLFRSIGQVLGVAFPAAIVQSTLTKDLPKYITGPDAEKIIATIRHSTEAIKSLSPEYREAAIKVYADALHTVFLANLGLSILGLLLLACIGEEEMPSGGELPDAGPE